MIEKLLAKYNLTKESSMLIGDSLTDVEAATRAGIQAIRIPSNCNMQPYISTILL